MDYKDNEELKRDLKEIKDAIHRIQLLDVEQNMMLKEHIRRTELAENAIEILKDSVLAIQSHVSMVNGGMKLFGVLSLVSGSIYGIIKLIQLIP